MDVQIHIQDDTKTFSSGDLISGKIQIFCAQATTVSKITTTLIGESTSSLTGAPGLLFSRREEERHQILREEYRIVPSLRTYTTQESRAIRLDVGCHNFDFRLRVPWIQDCSSCPPNTPVKDEHDYNSTWDGPVLSRRLPPSTRDLQKGNEVAYRIDVAITTVRNMFKSRTVKTLPITIWPSDTQAAQRDGEPTPRAAITTARATILGPSSLPLPSHVLAEEAFGLAPAEILITATFQPDFQLVRNPSVEAQTTLNRDIAMDLSVKKLNHHPQDLYLQSFQMLLVGYTDIRAGAATHGHMTFWTLQSLSNIGLQVFTASDAPGTQRKIDSRLWDGVTLDDSVVPHFTTCNLERRYELEVLMGWQCQSGEHAGRVFFVQARTPVRISSGIRPGKQNEKMSTTWSENDVRITSECKESQCLRNEGLRRTYAEFNAPPTYDEAVRATVQNGLKGFEMRNAGGW